MVPDFSEKISKIRVKQISTFFLILPILPIFFLQIRIQNDSFSRVSKFGPDRADFRHALPKLL